MEGHTGYLVVPSARTLTSNSMELAWNRHFNRPNDGAPYNVLIAGSPLPWTEFVARDASPDLSLNAKLGIPLVQTKLYDLTVGAGIQDLLGGARLYHADYGLITARFGPVEASVGWGDGTDPMLITIPCAKGTCLTGATYPRLQGWFQGGSLGIPLPDRWPLQASLLEDMDGNTWRLGGRLVLSSSQADLEFMVANPVDSLQSFPEMQWTAHYRFADSVAPTPKPVWDLTPMVLQLGPWAQTFVGTEVGNFDAQVAVDAELYAFPFAHFVAGTRLRSRVWQTSNLEEKGPLHSQLQNPRVWWESSDAGFVWGSSQTGILLVQGGWIGGDNLGPSLNLQTPDWNGLHAAFFGGWWYSPGWETTRTSLIPGLCWSSPKRTWFGQLDAGRFWNQDQSVRLRIGKRWGALSTSVAVFEALDTKETLAEGRLTWSFSTDGFKPFEALTIRLVPEWSHGLRTKVAEAGKNMNYLRLVPAVEPPVLIRIPN